jgi:hypothetical protein
MSFWREKPHCVYDRKAIDIGEGENEEVYRR